MRGFTLIELMVVIGLMGFLGTASVGGYRAMQRGMEERGVMDNVNQFIRTAYQRAQIDRQPTAVYFWNEVVSKASDYGSEVIVGKAVAIRRAGRITKVDGRLLYDEFAGLEHSYGTDDDQDSNSASEATGDNRGSTMYLYPIDIQHVSSGLKRSIVYQKVYGNEKTVIPMYLSGDASGQLSDTDAGDDELQQGEIKVYAFKLSSDDLGDLSWKPGMAYGFEFAQLELPKNYIFGTSADASGAAVQPQGTLAFSVGECSGSGVDGGIENNGGTIRVSSLRPGQTGALAPELVGTSRKPTEDL